MNLEYKIINTLRKWCEKIEAHSGFKGQGMSIESWREETSSISAHCLQNLKIDKNFAQVFVDFIRFMANTFASIYEVSSRIIDTFRLHYRPFLQVSDCFKNHRFVFFETAGKQRLEEGLPLRLHVSMARYANVYPLLLETSFLSCNGGIAPFESPFLKTHKTVFLGSLGGAAL